MPDVFISHSAADKDLARKLARDLSQQDLSVWLDETSLKPGDNWAASIQEAISNSDNFLAILSRNEDASPWLNTEIAIAIASSQHRGPKRIIPLVADDGVDLPPFLRQFQSLNISSDDKYKTNIDELIQVIKAPAGTGPLPSPELLKKYDQIVSGSAGRMLEMAEAEALHRRSLESKSDPRNVLLPSLAAALLSVALTILFVLYGKNGLDEIAALSLGVVSGALVTTLFHLLRARDKSGNQSAK